VFAQAVATIDAMFPGRFELGVGTGEALNEAPFTENWPEWRTRAEHLVETLELYRELWYRDEYFDFAGDYLYYEDLKLYTHPNEQIQVNWAAWGPQSAVLAGEHAGNLLSAASPSLFLNRLIPRFEEGLERADRSLAKATISTEMMANVGDPAALVEETRDRGEHLPHETELDTPDPRDIQTVANERLNAMNDEEIRDSHNITDDPEEFVDLIRKFESVGVDRVLVGSQVGDPATTIEAFEETVLPEFQATKD
jgi:coenzyme F420-dependent glucose-6-phosphate dehydrogenase